MNIKLGDMGRKSRFRRPGAKVEEERHGKAFLFRRQQLENRGRPAKASTEKPG